MCGKSADNGFERVAARLREARSLLVTTHARSDGDAVGSMLGLGLAARAAGKVVRMLVPDAPAERYQCLYGDEDIARAADFRALADEADVIAIVDTCATAQLEGIAAALGDYRGKIVVVDHHATADDISECVWADTSAAAAGVMVCELIDALGWPMDSRTAEALMTAITTDTGWLRFANTDARCLRRVARLVELGVRPDVVYRRVYQTDRPERLALVARVLQSMELHAGGRLAAMTIRKSDFDATGATPEETENLVNEALRIESVETAIIVIENDDCIRCSLRSRDDINVAEIARRFGGGGHQRAAGVRVKEPIDAVRRKLIAACEAEMNRVAE